MIRSIYLSLFFMYIVSGCAPTDDRPEPDKWKQEIMDAEKAFNDMAQEKGLAEAFYHFAAEDAVLKRKNRILKGKNEIRRWYEKDSKPGEKLTWQPDFVDVSRFGDLGYTYGNYKFTYSDSLGSEKSSTGIFHTVWKRQTDDSWKFVYD